MINETRTRRSILAAMAALPMGLAVACGQGAGAGSSAAPAASKVTGKVLVMLYQTSSPKVDLQMAMYDDFNKEYKPKGLEVEYTNPGSTALIEKVTALHAAGTPADVYEHPRLWRELDGLINDLSAYFKRDKIDEKQWFPESVNVMRDGSKMWGMPVSISADAVAYNLDLFEQAGIKPPPQDPDDRSWTMEAFLDAAKKLTKGQQQFGAESKFTGGIDWANWPTWFGYGPVDLANKKVTINTPGFQQGLQFWIDLTNRHHVMPTSAELAPLRSVAGQDSFLTGKIGMKGIFAVAEKPQFRWGLAAQPYTPNPQQPKNVSARISVHSIFIDNTSKVKDQAWEIFKYWMKPENDAKYVLSDGHVVSPLVKGAFEITTKDFKDKYGADPKAFQLMAQHSKVDAWGYYLLKDWAKARADIDTIFTDCKNEKMSVAEFAKRAQEITERTASF